MVRAQLGPPSKQKHLQMFVSAFLLYPNFGLTTFSITTHLPFFSLSYRWRELVAPAHLVPPNLSKTFYNPLLVTTFPLFRPNIPPLKGARGMLSPIAYSLRPSTFSLFFRLETPFLTFFASLYYIMSQLFIYPSYTNRPRFV